MGWLHFLTGFTSLSWLHLASINALDSQKSDRKRGEHRLHTLLQALHTFTRSLWLGRNEALHSTNKETTDAVKFNADSAEIRHYFNNLNMRPAEDRHYCAHNMTKLLRSRPSVHRRWLQRVRTARSNMLKHGRSQLTMTKYYALDPQPTGTDRQNQNTTNPTNTASQNPRTRTTQQRMTSFFPGRPPDSNNQNPNPGNPPPI